MESSERYALIPGKQVVEVDQLHESAENPRSISSERLEALKRSLEKDPEMLDARPVIALPDGEVVAGNMRLRAAQELGRKQIPAYIADLNPVQKREWMLRDNREYGDWVPDQLAQIIRIHQEDGGDLDMLGFKDDDLQELLRRIDAEAIVPDATQQKDPEIKSEVMIEVYCSQADLAEFSATLEEWAERDGVEVNISG